MRVNIHLLKIFNRCIKEEIKAHKLTFLLDRLISLWYRKVNWSSFLFIPSNYTLLFKALLIYHVNIKFEII